MSVSTGLISGMDTASIIDQLMQVEANPQTLLKQRMSSDQAKATAYRAINTRFDALRTASEALSKDTTWQSVKAASSSPSVSASSSAGASAGALTFTVNDIARSHVVVSAQKWTATGAQTAADLDYGTTSLDVVVGGVTTSIALDKNGNGTATLAEAAAAINARPELGLSATAVKVSDTEYRLQVATSKTGASSEFTVGTTGQFDVVTQGTNAKLTIGTGTGYTMTSPTNTFSGLVDGTTITVTEPISNVTLSVVSNPQAVADKVAALVSAANGLLDAIASYTKPDSKSAALKGDSTLRQLSTQILDTVSSTLGADGSLAGAGLQLTRDGHFVFDSTKFLDKMSADPTVLRRMFTEENRTTGVDGIGGNKDDVVTPIGIVGRLAKLAVSASDETTGTLTLLAKSKDTAATDLQERIDNWDIRLELRRNALSRQFTAMETALSTLQNQSSWLSSQISSLPSWSSSKS
jgi:flagellar hook-associated protein 2